MIWVEAASGRFYSNSDGTVRWYNVELQDWGLQVKDILAALVVTGKSASTARVRVRFNDGAKADLNALITTGSTDIIGSLATPATPPTVPGTIKGSFSGGVFPFIQFQIGIVSSAAAEEWLDLRLFAGGKPY